MHVGTRIVLGVFVLLWAAPAPATRGPDWSQLDRQTEAAIKQVQDLYALSEADAERRINRFVASVSALSTAFPSQNPQTDAIGLTLHTLAQVQRMVFQEHGEDTRPEHLTAAVAQFAKDNRGPLKELGRWFARPSGGDWSTHQIVEGLDKAKASVAVAANIELPLDTRKEAAVGAAIYLASGRLLANPATAEIAHKARVLPLDQRYTPDGGKLAHTWHMARSMALTTAAEQVRTMAHAPHEREQRPRRQKAH